MLDGIRGSKLSNSLKKALCYRAVGIDMGLTGTVAAQSMRQEREELLSVGGHESAAQLQRDLVRIGCPDLARRVAPAGRMDAMPKHTRTPACSLRLLGQLSLAGPEPRQAGRAGSTSCWQVRPVLAVSWALVKKMSRSRRRPAAAERRQPPIGRAGLISPELREDVALDAQSKIEELSSRVLRFELASRGDAWDFWFAESCRVDTDIEYELVEDTRNTWHGHAAFQGAR